MGCCRVSTAEPAATSFPEPERIAEEDAEGQQDRTIPQYWTNKRYPDSASFHQLVYVSAENLPVFQELLQETYLPLSTKDRPCPKASDPCARQSQGCPCVQPGGDPGLPIEYRILRAVRVENSASWTRYATKRDSIRKARASGKDRCRPFDPPVLTNERVQAHPDLFEPLAGRINETYLFHGARVRTALSIAQNDFNLDMAGTGRGAMYGPGAYCAESCTKADEYAHGEAGGYYGEDVHALLLCRVCMGKMYYTTQFGQEDAVEKVTKGWCDSVLGDLSKFRKTFREFVVYDAAQIYPEYVLMYARVHRADASYTARPGTFHLELPVYWRNCHLDPQRDTFNSHCHLRRSTCDALQRFITESVADSGVRLKEAWRIEHSNLWCQYVQFKAKVRAGLPSDSSHCAYTNQVGAGFVKTMSFLRDQFVEETFTANNLEIPLNEHLLWFGAPRKLVDAVVRGELDICKALEDSEEEPPLGRGAYFTDDFQRCLGRSSDDSDGPRRVLLCRVCLGEIHLAEEATQDAQEAARLTGKHSVFAVPATGESTDQRDFVILESQQAYPEFILDVGLEAGAEPLAC